MKCTRLNSIFLVSVFLYSCQFSSEKSKNKNPSKHPQNINANPLETELKKVEKKAAEKKSQIEIHEVKLGKGPAVTKGNRVNVHYIARLENGVIISDSRKNASPFNFTIGRNEAILGWETALLGMKAGGIRKVKIPSNLAYGSKGLARKVPPNANIMFKFELISIAQ